MNRKFLIIRSKFNDLVTRSLLEGAKDTLNEAGISAENIDIVDLPGCFEMPALAAKVARRKTHDAIICLGCVIRGETPHFDFVAGETARGLMNISVETEIPIAFGVITADTMDQALARSGLKGGNKGIEATSAALSALKAHSTIEAMERN